MKKILVKKNNNYTTINNEFIFNKEMSLKAKGLLCHLLALPENWELYVEELEKWHKDGKSAIYSAFKELSKLGYIERLQRREKGLFKGFDYIVYEKPNIEKPKTDKPKTENRTLLNTDIILNTNNTKKRFDFESLEELNIEVWKKWKEYRKEQFRINYKPIGEKAAIGKLLRISQGCHKVQEQIIQQSIENGWKGIFELKNQVKSKTENALDNWQKARKMINNG
jgi:predicted transcriptional regulator